MSFTEAVPSDEAIRRILAGESVGSGAGQSAARNQAIVGTSIVNELKLGFNRPRYDAFAFGPSGYDPAQVSLSGTVTSQSIDARGTTGIARSGLLVRATSNASTNGQAYDPRSIVIRTR